MHYHLEIIMPPTKDIGKALESVMEPFSEHNEENTETFWDWYVVGGRWAGTKETCGYAQEKIDAFYKVLNEKKITVSGIQCGKHKLEPESQIPIVDKLWNDFFPTEKGEIIACPMFSHSNNQYDGNDLISCDICLVEEIPESLTASRVIIAGSEYKAKFMISDDMWNGVNFVKTRWDGKVLSTLEMAKEKFRNYTEEYREKNTPKPNWICITIDYHS